MSRRKQDPPKACGAFHPTLHGVKCIRGGKCATEHIGEAQIGEARATIKWPVKSAAARKATEKFRPICTYCGERPVSFTRFPGGGIQYDDCCTNCGDVAED